MYGLNFYAQNAKRAGLLMLVVIAAAAVIPQLVQAHLLNGTKGPVDAFNYDGKLVQHLDVDCGQALECKQTDAKNVFFFSCYYDVGSAECQCSKGDFSRCNVSSSSLDAKQAAAIQNSGGGANKGILGLARSAFAAPGFFFSRFMGLPLLAKLFILAVAAAAVILAFNRLKDSAANNLRTAKDLHEEASVLNEKGEEDKAKALLDKSNYYREKAYEQMQPSIPKIPRI